MVAIGSSASPVLSVTNVSLTVGATAILHDVDLAVGAGETIGLVGANGSGKSSLLNVVSRYYRASGGRVCICGVDTINLPPNGIAALGVGRSFQSVAHAQSLTVSEYLRLGMEAEWPVGLMRTLLALPSSRRAERDAKAEVAKWAAAANLEGYLDTPMRECSYGVRKIADVVRAVLTGKRLVLLDEPTSGVAVEDRTVIAKVVRELTLDGSRGVVLVDHDVDFVAALASELVVLNSGQVISRGPIGVVRRDPVVIESFLGAPAEETSEWGHDSQERERPQEPSV